MDQKEIFLTIIGMALVTFIPRLMPLVFLVNRSLPSVVSRWLGYIPSAVLAAMLFPTLFTKDRQLVAVSDNLFLWAGIVTFIIAWRTKSMFVAIVTGMVFVAGARFLLGV